MPEHLTSRNNPRVKDAVKLKQRRQRERQGRFFIDGVREIDRALDAGLAIVEAFVCESLCTADEAQTLAKRLEKQAKEYFTVSPDVFEKLCFGERTDGVLAVAATPKHTLEDIELPERPLIAVLEGLEKPGNIGAALRSADGAGLDAVIVANPGTDLFNPNTVRASLGTVFGGNIASATSEETIEWLRANEIPAYAARPEANHRYDGVIYQNGAAIVLGSESEGLSDVWYGAGVTAIGLPMHGIADSLNVSATAAVLFYEARRQWDASS